MTLEGAQSGVLQRLGVSYPQLIDYSSKEYTATLVSFTLTTGQFTQAGVGTTLYLSPGDMGLYHHLV